MSFSSPWIFERAAWSAVVLSCLHTAFADVRINEFVSEHQAVEIWPNAPKDLDGDYPDWIEIYNTGPSSVNLQDWRLTDDDAVPAKWTFPSVSIASNGYLLVYASNKNRAVAGVQLHTNFKLGSTGVLVLSKPDGTVASRVGTAAVPYPEQRILASYGCVGNGTNPPYSFLTTITPDAANSSGAVSDFCADPTFSVGRGLYESSFTTQISVPMPDASLVYTLNGSEPTLTNGSLVLPSAAGAVPSVSLLIADSTIVRARVFKTGLGPSGIITQSYIFWSRILTQTGPLPSMGALTTAPWGYVGNNLSTPPGEDWTVDPNITGAAVDPAIRFIYDDLKSAPTVSLVVPWKGMFGPSTTTSSKDGGIYVGAEASVGNEGVDRAASLELINPSGSTSSPNAVKGFHAYGVVHIFGGSSPGRWKQYKLSMNFKPVDDVKYDVYGNGAATKQHNFILDAQSNQTWLHPDQNQRLWGEYMRDLVMADLQNKLGGQTFRGRPAHLFVNGMYWGMYNLHEQPSEQFDENYYGDDADNWDVFKHNIGTIVSGTYINPAQAISSTNSTTRANFEALLDLLGDGFTAPNPAPDLTQQANYEAVWTKLDQTDFLNYMILNFLSGNSDWSHQNLFACYNRADPNAKWRFQSWDAEHTFKNPTDSSVNYDADTSKSQGCPEEIHHLLMVNAEYRLTFADAVQRLMFNGGPLAVAGVQAAFINRLNQIDTVIRGESARWGNSRRTPAYNRNDLLTERNRILNTVIPQRWTKILGDFRTYNMYPLNTGGSAVATPEFRDDATNVVQQGGIVPAGFKLKLANITLGSAGTVYYTTDGSDPRTLWTSVPSPAAQIYTTPFQLNSPTRVKTRVRNGTTWSAVNDALFLVDAEAAAAGNLVISKISYHPDSTTAETAAGYSDTDFEFIELMNIGAKTVDLLGASFSAGIDFFFTDLLPIRFVAPGGRVLIVRNKVAFEFRYGTALPVVGVFLNDTGLSNSGEPLTLVAAGGGTISDVTFSDHGLWSTKADGSGPALVLIRPKTNPNLSDPANWRISTTSKGSPGVDDRILYSSWRTSIFPPSDAIDDAISGPTADPDGDGIRNLLEYARGTNPLSQDSAANPTFAVESINPGTGLKDYGVLRIRYLPAAEDAVLTPQMSANLVDWTGSGLSVLSSTENNDGTVTRAYRVTTPVEQDITRFLHLNAEYKP